MSQHCPQCWFQQCQGGIRVLWADFLWSLMLKVLGPSEISLPLALPPATSPADYEETGLQQGNPKVCIYPENEEQSTCSECDGDGSPLEWPIMI